MSTRRRQMDRELAIETAGTPPRNRECTYSGWLVGDREPFGLRIKMARQQQLAASVREEVSDCQWTEVVGVGWV
jgi:hypothetical protein